MWLQMSDFVQALLYIFISRCTNHKAIAWTHLLFSIYHLLWHKVTKTRRYYQEIILIYWLISVTSICE